MAPRPVFPTHIMVAAHVHYRAGHTWEEVSEYLLLHHGFSAEPYHLADRVRQGVARGRVPGCRPMTPEEAAEHRRKIRARKGNDKVCEVRFIPPVRSMAAYDPDRDGPPVFAHPFAELLGEPPVGRRAIDQRGRA